jgi:hypothetical protein
MERKEAYRMYFLVKGHINITDATAFSSADGYFARLWRDGADGAPLYDYDEAFQKAWEEKLFNEELVQLAIQAEKLA